MSPVKITEPERKILRDILRKAIEARAWPDAQTFRIRHEPDRQLLDRLVETRLLRLDSGRYHLTLDGLEALEWHLAQAEMDACNILLRTLKAAYRRSPQKTWEVSELARQIDEEPRDIGRWLTYLMELTFASSWRADPQTGFVEAVSLNEQILDVEPLAVMPSPPEAPVTKMAAPAHGRIRRLDINGYRPFADFKAEFGDLTIIIGANASGKSSLFNFLRFIGFAASNPLPAEIDPRTGGQTLFHVGGPEAISFSLIADLAQRKPLRYEVEIHGPVGTPRVTRERLATTEPLAPKERNPFVFLDFRAGKGVVRNPTERRLTRPPWTVEPNELALRRALDPTLVTVAKFQQFLSSWRFYSGFDVSSSSAIRRPAPTEPEPVLAEDGSNLSAMLFSLLTEQPDAWRELEVHLRSAIPGFRSLNIKAHGGPGTVIAAWREDGVDGDLTLADLSDGTLRFLCWTVLCLSPTLPPVVAIDEPELGLHPRVLPVLAALLRIAARRSQVLVATHSPYFLSQFGLSEIAVMRKDDGRALFFRPSSSGALRREIEKIGPERLATLHISDEFEARL